MSKYFIGDEVRNKRTFTIKRADIILGQKHVYIEGDGLRGWYPEDVFFERFEVVNPKPQPESEEGE